ncbi:MAG: hypothetical protein EU541_04115 [Promethearchaeota archaeon]|nr:MAG: hypothetical protein EU541_04115 [Candidatus Lokiarchaeota archaeon]
MDLIFKNRKLTNEVRKLSKENEENEKIEFIKTLVDEGRFDDAVDAISTYLEKAEADEEEELHRLEEIIEAILSIHGGKTVLRFLIENHIIDIPGLLQNLSKRDNVLRYSFLLLLKPIVEVEYDLFLPHIEELLESPDPNVKEAALQLIIFISMGDKKIDDRDKIEAIAKRLSDEKDYVIEKAIQALIAIGKKSPSLVTKTLKNYIEEFPDDEELKKNVDEVLKSIVSVEKIGEIVEEEKQEEEKKEEAETEGKEKSEEKPQKEFEEKKDLELEKKAQEIRERKKTLRMKDLEIKEKKLELEEKEKELEEQELQEKKNRLKRKEELLAKEKQLAQAELDLKEKELSEKEEELKQQEIERITREIQKLKEKEDELFKE